MILLLGLSLVPPLILFVYSLSTLANPILTSLPQLGGWPAYIVRNASGQRRYPPGTNRTFVFILLLREISLTYFIHRFQSFCTHVCSPSLPSDYTLCRRCFPLVHGHWLWHVQVGLPYCLQNLSGTLPLGQPLAGFDYVLATH